MRVPRDMKVPVLLILNSIQITVLLATPTGPFSAVFVCAMIVLAAWAAFA